MSLATLDDFTIFTLANGVWTTVDFVATEPLTRFEAESSKEDVVYNAMPTSLATIEDDLEWQRAVTAQFSNGVAPSCWSSIPLSVRTWFTSYDLYAVRVDWTPSATTEQTDVVVGDPDEPAGRTRSSSSIFAANTGLMSDVSLLSSIGASTQATVTTSSVFSSTGPVSLPAQPGTQPSTFATVTRTSDGAAASTAPAASAPNTTTAAKRDSKLMPILLGVLIPFTIIIIGLAIGIWQYRRADTVRVRDS